MGVMFSGDRLGEGDGCVDCGSDEGDDVSYERGDTRKLESSSPSLNNSTSHHLFPVSLAAVIQLLAVHPLVRRYLSVRLLLVHRL